MQVTLLAADAVVVHLGGGGGRVATTPPATSWPPALPVMAIGGFNGSDPSPTLAQFQQYVADGKVHYFIGGGGFGGLQNGGSCLVVGDRDLGGAELHRPDRRRRHRLRPHRHLDLGGPAPDRVDHLSTATDATTPAHVMSVRPRALRGRRRSQERLSGPCRRPRSTVAGMRPRSFTLWPLAAGPFADLGGAVVAAAGTPPGRCPAAERPPTLRAVPDVLGQRVPECRGILGAQVDLVGHPVQREGHGLVGTAAVDVVDQDDLHFLRHAAFLLLLGRNCRPERNAGIPEGEMQSPVRRQLAADRDAESPVRNRRSAVFSARLCPRSSARFLIATTMAMNAAQTTTGGSQGGDDVHAQLPSGLSSGKAIVSRSDVHPGEQPDQPVDAQAHPALRRHAELHRPQEVLVELHRLGVAAGRLAATARPAVGAARPGR